MHHALKFWSIVGCALCGVVSLAAYGDDAAGKACALLTQDLVIKVETAEGRKIAERAKPIEGGLGEDLVSCDFGRITLVLDPMRNADQARNAMRAKTGPWKNYRPVSGVGDAAFFGSDSAFANLYVWTGKRHFHVQMGMGFGPDDAETLRPVTIELAKAIVPQLR
jgi:hypothetical protein